MITGLAEIIWGVSLCLLAYTYLGYPLLLRLVSLWRARPVKTAPYEPTVSIIITAYNEERDLAAKLENTLALDYPSAKLDILVASDCSGDATDDITRRFAPQGVRLHRQTMRGGKTAAQNAAIEQVNSDIVVFSDATTLYQPDVLRAMMPNFADKEVGCVAGKLIYVDPGQTTVGAGAKSYWGYETFLKTHESRIWSLIGTSGCLYAVRRAAYVPLYPEACSDFIIASKMVEQGLRTVYEPQAVCIEETNQQGAKEIKMRVRVITQTFTDLWRHRHLMNPLHSGFYAVQLLSHKVLRYLVPFFLGLFWLASASLAWQSWFYQLVFAAQVIFYAAAAAGWWLEKAGYQVRLLALPQYFVLANLASVMAAYQFAKGERYASWEPIRMPLSTTAAPSKRVTE